MSRPLLSIHKFGCPARIRTWVRGAKDHCATVTLPGNALFTSALKLACHTFAVSQSFQTLPYLINVNRPAYAEYVRSKNTLVVPGSTSASEHVAQLAF